MKTQLLVRLVIVLYLFNSGPLISQKIYLSPAGNDSDRGTIEKPLATLSAARDKARELRKNMNTGQPVEIIALEGEYFMFQPLFLTADDAGKQDSPPWMGRAL